jgi:hypothetical protein
MHERWKEKINTCLYFELLAREPKLAGMRYLARWSSISISVLRLAKWEKAVALAGGGFKLICSFGWSRYGDRNTRNRGLNARTYAVAACCVPFVLRCFILRRIAKFTAPVEPSGTVRHPVTMSEWTDYGQLELLSLPCVQFEMADCIRDEKLGKCHFLCRRSLSLTAVARERPGFWLSDGPDFRLVRTATRRRII